jgi:signal transduction histidine kinase
VTPPSILQELKHYVGFTPEDADLLARLRSRLAPAFPAVVEEFYEAVRSNPSTMDVFEDDAQIERQKRALREWMEGVFSGTYDDAYFHLRARIGRVHVRVGLEQRFMFGAMNIVRTGFHRALDALGEDVLDNLDRSRGHCAIDRICDIELAIMVETYREDYVLRRTAESQTMAAMGRLTAGLAHEIRNPLNAAKLQLELLARNVGRVGEPALRASAEERVEIVRSELKRLASLLDDFLSLARPHQVRPVAVRSSSLLRNAVELEAPLLEAAGVTIAIEDDADVEVLADAHRIKQVIVNLITNAAEAIAGAGGESDVGRGGEVRLSCAVVDGSFAEIRISDNGPGVDPEIAPQVFDAFVTSKDAGTGLGLTIVKGIVEMHGGALLLTSRDGGGTDARFTLPLARSVADERAPTTDGEGC